MKTKSIMKIGTAQSIVEAAFIAGRSKTSWRQFKKEVINQSKKSNNMKTGIELIAQERQKQIDKHGFTGAHHVDHPEWYDNFQLQYAATTLLMHEFEEVVDTTDNLPDGWDQDWFDKLNAKQRKDRLIIAAALIAAELDRLETGLLLEK